MDARESLRYLVVRFLFLWAMILFLLPSAAPADVEESPASDDFQQLLLVRQNERWGYIDLFGNIVIKPSYDLAFPFSDGLAEVCVRSLIQPEDSSFPVRDEFYVNARGEIVIDNRTNKGWLPFFEGVTSARAEGTEAGYMDRSGEMVIEPVFSTTFTFTEGLGSVMVDEKWGFIDHSGEIVIEPQFNWTLGFSEGLAAVSCGSSDIDGQPGWGYIDHSGSMVIEAQYEWTSGFYDGMALVGDGEKYGYIDNTGKLAIDFQYEWAYPFWQDRAAVWMNGKWGYIDKSGEVIITPKFGKAGSFNEGLAPVETEGLWGYIDVNGNFVIEPQFELGGCFMNGLAVVTINGRQGCIDPIGQIAIEPEYDCIESSYYCDGLTFMFGRDSSILKRDGSQMLLPSNYRSDTCEPSCSSSR